MGVEGLKPEVHQFACMDNENVVFGPAQARKPGDHITFPTERPWVALADKDSQDYLALGAPAADLKRMAFRFDVKAFELTRAAGDVSPDDPLREHAWIGFGKGVGPLKKWQRAYEDSVFQPPHAREPRPAAPALQQAPPAARWDVGVTPVADGWGVAAGDFRIEIGGQDGALRSWETDSGQWLARPGGVYCVAADQKQLGPGGTVSNAQQAANALQFDWACGGLTAHHRIEPHQGYIAWDVRIPNPGKENLLLETRLALPANLGTEPWYYWDGISLRKVGADERKAEMTTLAPGDKFSQGIFPAVGLHNAKAGMAVGLAPADIESFYGSRARPALGPLETFYYAVRMAIPPGGERRVQFVLFATDPNWSWRSLVDRYWGFWPDVFAAPARDDVWGLYGLVSGPKYIFADGDKFIDRCRRYRVGGMELSAPFSRTGDFYAPEEPAYRRKLGEMNREDLRRAYDIANTASCNLSFVTPNFCERQLADTQFADSIVHRENGAPWYRDSGILMPTEKLAHMFAWGDSFGEHVRADLRRILEDYKPQGFYLDIGALVASDYGRMTEWAAFDDKGRVYTNTGIALAKLVEDAHAFAPGAQLTPGEEVQYFSGFHAQGHLANHTNIAPHYVRSMRLILGRKPVWTSLPAVLTKAVMEDTLEAGGLPNLGMHFDPAWEATAREWAPVTIALARAGWNPIPQAVADGADVRIERFGSDAETFFTVRNLTDQPAKADLRLKGLYPRLSEFRNRVPLHPRVDQAQGETAVSFTIPATELVVLRAEPEPAAAPKEWPKIDFLAKAEPVSVVAPETVAAQHAAHCVMGFVELQADLLKRKTEVEIVADAAKAKFPNRVLIQVAPNAALTAKDANTLVLSGPDESALRHLLGEYLETIEKPLGDQGPLWTLAAPAP
ncbi:MAG: hypothetical protein NTW86_24140 [Candidatus Sumerlaeota bacterium]|nr:hypothetical protein [Candidatus Sumerlaeota bacterium]